MANNPKTTKASQAFSEYLRACNMRVTPERLAIVDVISKIKGLFSVDELHNLMIREAFPVSVATIYNTIDLLKEAGLLKCLKIPERSTALYRLDLADAHHVYLICQLCGSVKEVSAKALQRYVTQYDFASFMPLRFSLNVYGLCKKCRKK